jgi:hypothetical protein
MEVVSEPGKGSIFSVYLPKAGPTEMTENGLYVVSKV